MVQLQLRRHVREKARAESTLLALLEERTQAENLARASEASMVRAQRLAHLGSWEVTLPSGRLDWSEECYHIFGLDRATFTATYKAFLGCRPSH